MTSYMTLSKRSVAFKETRWLVFETESGAAFPALSNNRISRLLERCGALSVFFMWTILCVLGSVFINLELGFLGLCPKPRWVRVLPDGHPAAVRESDLKPVRQYPLQALNEGRAHA